MSVHCIDVSAESFAQDVEAHSAHCPVLVDYWASWCGPCKALAPVLERVVDGFDGRLRLAKVDTDANQSLAQAHGIRSLPTVRLYRNGKPVAEFMGAQPESAVRDFIARYAELDEVGALAEARSLMRAGDPDAARAHLEAHLAATPDDAEARIALAELELETGHPDAAERTLSALPESKRRDEPVPALLAKIRFGLSPNDDRVDGDDIEARYQRALSAIARGDVDQGLDGLLAIVREDRSFRDDGARKALLDAFLALGEDDPRVALTRGRLFSLLH